MTVHVGTRSAAIAWGRPLRFDLDEIRVWAVLREHRAPALPVSDGPRFIGLVDEKALLRLTPSEATTLGVYELREVLDRMTVSRVVERIPGVAPGAPLDEAETLMRSEGRDVLPVLDGGHLVGLLHWTGIVRYPAIVEGGRIKS